VKRALLAALVLACTLAPRLALAKAIEDVTIGADASDIVINVISDEPLNAPAVRTYPGAVRLRFYDAKDPTQLKLPGDGGALRSVEVGQGSDHSAALTLLLGDKTRLSSTDVRIEMRGATISLRIARGLLPALREPEKSADKPADKPAGPPAPAPAAQPAAAPAPAPAQANAPLAPAEPAADKPTAAQKPAFPLAAKKAPGEKDEAPASDLKLQKDAGRGSAVPILLTVTALLALAYAGMRLFMKKKGLIDTIPAIDVVAQRRLGPRHQLVVVRAFDRDYLLSIQGSQTTLVARSSRRRVPGSRAPSAAAAASDMDVMLPAMPLARTPTPAPPAARDRDRDFEEDDEVTFGGELFRHALEQRERARENTTGMRLEAARAEARAEIARMEAARRESEPVRGIAEPVRGLSDRASELLRASTTDNDNDRDQTREDESEGGFGGDSQSSLPPSADGISESVTGLLRLRRKSGR